MKTTAKVLLLLILVACSSTEQNSNSKVNSRPSAKKTFEYQPQSPEDGQLMASIEIGSLGLNYFIISIDQQDRWETIRSEFGRSNLIFNESDLGEIETKVESFKNVIIENGVDPSNIHVVASSSSLEFVDTEELKKTVEQLGLQLHLISAKQEANYSLIAAVPKEFTDESFLVDMGSGNTKLSWVNNGDTISIDNYGSKYYLDGTPDSAVFRTFRESLLKIPLKNRNLCFMIGGTPYEFANHSNNRVGRYSILQAPSTYPDNEEKWKAGVVIYEALVLSPTYSYIFDWEANFSIGFLTTVN